MEVISVVGQKGGCGKTTMTILLASTLAYKYKKKVAVLDCDTLQQSLTKSRINDLALITPYEAVDENGKKVKMVQDGVMFKQFKEQNIKPYDIVRCKENVDDIINYLMKKDEEGCDYALLDLPGNVDNTDYFRIVSLCSIVFLPFIVDSLDFDSNFAFAKHTHQRIFCGSERGGVFGRLLCHLADVFEGGGNETCRPLVFQSYCEKIKNELPDLEMLRFRLGNTKAVGNDKCRNTLLPPNKQFLGYGKLGPVLNEMYEKIKKI